MVERRYWLVLHLLLVAVDDDHDDSIARKADGCDCSFRTGQLECTRDGANQRFVLLLLAFRNALAHAGISGFNFTEASCRVVWK
jgi:hypothetical protein